MRKYMNIINRLLFGAVALAALSCTGNFETYNRNPDQPSTIDRDSGTTSKACSTT